MPELETARKAILCIDSDPESSALVTSALADHEVVIVRNAYDAITEVNRRGFDAYVLDYWLEDWAGPGLCREIRKLDPHAPILFCTAAGKDENKGRGLRAGANAYLVKPVSRAEVRAKVDGLLAMADRESLQAKRAAEAAIQGELERRFAAVRERVGAAIHLSTQAFERIARIKAYKSYLEQRGSRAHFERWWPQLFQSAQAVHAAEREERRA